MTIEINNNVRMTAALDKVAEGKYFDALCLFARVDSYESVLNQIGCLCHLHDTGYAVELYRRLLAKYYFTHNLYRDLSRVSSQAVDLLGFFDSELDADAFDENKISADGKLLGDFEIDDFDDEEFLEEFEEPLREKSFCDIRSSEYFFRLVERLHDETEKGNLKNARTLTDELLEFNSNDETVLEGQMLLCLAERDFDRGAEYAERFAALEHSNSYRGIAVAVGILSATNKHNETLKNMLAQLIEFADEITDSDLIEYVEIAESCFDNSELTGKLAEILYARHKDVGCEALRSCTRIFCNMGWKKQAKGAVLTLLNAVPWDSYAAVLLRYIDSDINVKLDKSFSNLTLLRHLDVPTQLAVISEYRLIQRIENEMAGGEECILHTDDYNLLHCIANVCKTHVYRGNSEKFVNDATVLATILFSFMPENAGEFYDFAKQQLCSFMPEPPVQKDILLRLIKLGYCDRLLISANKTYYSLDLSKVTVFDEAFLDALSLCAVLRKVDARRLQRNYLKIKEIADVKEVYDDGDARYSLTHKLAYCLLAVTYKDFAKSQIAEYFGEGDDALYLDYLSRI
ncbi:MAG: hypothetical protein J1F66_00040 [Clostridiales bacterium]|nr:hypothetical protein [Clostridiales bacterium]